jgi:hypothetical protein
MSGSDEEKFDHLTQKPIELMRRPILNHTKRGEGVYDPFLGSGTALAAAELAGHVCYGIELDPKYVDVIVMLWQSLTNQKAALDGDGRSFDEIAEERQKGAIEAQIRAALSDWVGGIWATASPIRNATVAPRLAHARSGRDYLAYGPKS